MESQACQLKLVFATPEELEAEFKANLSKGRAFVPGSFGFEERQHVELLIENSSADTSYRLKAEVVWRKPDPPLGLGVTFLGFGASERASLRGFCLGSAQSAPSCELHAPEHASSDSETPFATATGPQDQALLADAHNEEEEEGEEGNDPQRLHLYELVRRLSPREQQQWARQGLLSQRVALERVFGSAVWEALLCNPQLTAAEVARIAKKGSLPVPLVSLVVANAAWLSQGEVQRALLGNPRVNGQHLTRVLRALSATDLKRVPTQTAYRPQVRAAARELLKKA